MSPISRQRLPWVRRPGLAQASRWPIAAAATTWAIIPSTRISPMPWRTLPRTSEPKDPTTPARLPWRWSPVALAGSRPTGRGRGEDRGDQHRDRHRDRGDEDRRPDGGLGVEPDDLEGRVVDVAEAQRTQRDRARLVGGPRNWPGTAPAAPCREWRVRDGGTPTAAGRSGLSFRPNRGAGRSGSPGVSASPSAEAARGGHLVRCPRDGPSMLLGRIPIWRGPGSLPR